MAVPRLRLPSTSTPTCSKCSGLLLQHYSESLQIKTTTTTLNATLVSMAVDTVNEACGTAFVNYNAAAISRAPAAGSRYSGWSLVVAMVGVMLLTCRPWAVLFS